MRINFNEFPQRSMGQIMKLIKTFGEVEVKKGGGSRESEEKAAMMFECFGKKTSVLYDVQSLTEILKKDMEEVGGEHSIEIAANLIFMGLKFSEKMAQDGKDQFEKFLENAKEFLNLTTLNEILQTHRVNPFVYTALLRTFAFLSERGLDQF